MIAKRKKAKTQVTYLNIHAGVSVGVMAAMDVGANDRFEVSNYTDLFYSLFMLVAFPLLHACFYLKVLLLTSFTPPVFISF